MRKRDYKAEYARRKMRAQLRGFKGYHQERKYKKGVKDWVAHVVQRMDETGLLDSDFFHYETLDEILEDDTLFWELFRNYYGKATAA